MPVSGRFPPIALVKTDAEGNAPFSVNAAKLALWSPDSPRLLKVHLTAGDDQLTDDIRFRDIRVDGTRILPNGKRLLDYLDIHVAVCLLLRRR